MEDSQPKRGFISTLIMSTLTNGVAGLFWIGRPWLAVCQLLLLCAITYSMLAGWFRLPFEISPIQFALILSGISILVPLILRPRSRPKGWSSKWYVSVFLTLILSTPMFFAFRSLAYQPFNVPSGSMVPTLVHGDYVVGNKSIYGYGRYSFPYEIFSFEGRTAGALPERGDVVIFNFKGVPYIKRVIGLPGETVKMVDGVPQINGQAVTQADLGRYVLPSEGIDALQQRETLPNGRSYYIISLENGSVSDNTREYIVPAGNYFMLGDNRDNSNDSRFTLGFVPLENLIGRADRILANDEGLSFKDRKDLNANR
jgi:signal peptidase I